MKKYAVVFSDGSSRVFEAEKYRSNGCDFEFLVKKTIKASVPRNNVKYILLSE